ncbi:hypothetical protein [Methylobacterium sp. 22177]|uniref:hypothetical protein n=1 Tax=Methylobacterium sp. 22177 TaxID=3453885 RepID=UPI003F874A10
MYGDGKGLADILRGLIAAAESYAVLAIVVATVLGMFLAGYALVRLHRANQAEDGTALGWMIALIVASSMTCLGVVLGSVSFLFAD